MGDPLEFQGGNASLSVMSISRRVPKGSSLGIVPKCFNFNGSRQAYFHLRKLVAPARGQFMERVSENEESRPKWDGSFRGLGRVLELALELGRRLETHGLAGRDLDGFAGLRVPAGAGLALADGPGAETRIAETLILLDGFPHHVEGAIDDLGDRLLGQFGAQLLVAPNGIDQLGLGHETHRLSGVRVGLGWIAP